MKLLASLLSSVLIIVFSFLKDLSNKLEHFLNPEQPVEVISTSENLRVNSCTSPANNVENIVCKADAFKALLTTAQINTLQLPFTNALAQKWSNLPCGANCRNGIQFSTLNATQLAAAMEVIKAAAGTAANEGYAEFKQVLSADSVLGQTAGGYSKGIYFLAFLNAPSTTGAWMLQFGGHHYAANIAFNNGAVTGPSPRFEGIEPTTFTAAGGVTYSPLTQEKNAMAAIFASLTTAQLAQAHLTSTFSDIIMGPSKDGQFQTTKVGLAVSNLNTTQQALVLAAMEPWVKDLDDATAAAVLGIYQSELNNTYIAYSGTGNFTNHADYGRIDGPSVWVEFVCQNGIVIPNQIHYHSVYRDHTRDYGNYLSSTAQPLAVKDDVISGIKSISVYPNPTTAYITITTAETLKNATITVLNSTGKAVLNNAAQNGKISMVNVSKLPNGIYTVQIFNNGTHSSARFVKQDRN